MLRTIFTLVIAWGLLWGGAGRAFAEAVYVTETFEVTLRAGTGNEYKILAMLPSGTRLDLLEETDEWTRVQTQSGKEGWILKRYVTRDLPKIKMIERLQRENEQLKETATRATETAKKLEAENKELSSSLSGTQNELSGIQQEYASLRADSEDVVELKGRYDNISSKLQTVTAEREKLTVENQELRSGTRMQWFLTGAGLVGGSWLVGLIMGRIQRRGRRTSLY